MASAVATLPMSPRVRVASLEQAICGRGISGCVYLLPDELDVLLKLAWAGADAMERKELIMSVLKRRANGASA